MVPCLFVFHFVLIAFYWIAFACNSIVCKDYGNGKRPYHAGLVGRRISACIAILSIVLQL